MKKLAFIIFFAICSTLFAQQGKVEVSARISKGGIMPGDQFEVIFQFDMDKGLHIYAPGKQESEVPTIPVEIVPVKRQGFGFNPPRWPEPVTKEFPNLGKLKLYEGKTEVPIFVTMAADADLSTPLEFNVSYQACDDKQCFFPQEKSVLIDLKGSVQITDKSSKAVTNLPDSVKSQEIDKDEVLQPDAEFQKFLDDMGKTIPKGFFAAILTIFLAGLAASITPCVYPMIPLTVAFFSRQVKSIRSSRILLALTYVAGMSLTYSILGVSAGLAGSVFGSILGNKYVAIGVAIFFAIFGISMFGAFEIRMPSFLATKVGGAKQGYLGAFLMGLLVGIVAAPCVGPIFGSVLAYIATTQDATIGFAYSMSFALGMGVLFFVLALFPGILPKSGAWLEVVKNIFGVLLFAAAVWFVSPVLPTKIASLTIGILLFLLALYLLTKIRYSPKTLSVLTLASIIGGFLFAGGLWIKLGDKSLAETVTAVILLKPEEGKWLLGESALTQANKEGKPAIVDFYAEWCVQCKELEKTIFSDVSVEAALGRFAKIKFDLTDKASPNYERLTKLYGISGLPTIAFYSSQGKYLGKTGQVNAQTLLKILERVK